MNNAASLAKRLSEVSYYAARIDPLLPKVPGLMESNNQLRPLWEVWCLRATPGVTPEQVFTKDEIRVLRSFFEYLYFASDAFARSVVGRR